MIVVAQVAVGIGLTLPAGGDAIAAARDLVGRGARGIVLRDVDGRLATASGQASWLGRFQAEVGVPASFDGPLLEPKAVERVASAGFATIFVGQAALFDPLALRWAADLVGDRLAVELRGDGHHLFDPPRSAGHVELVEAARRLRFLGIRHVLYRDVTGMELPVDRLRAICDGEGMRVTFAGAVRTLDDISRLASLRLPGLVATIVGAWEPDGEFPFAEANRVTGR